MAVVYMTKLESEPDTYEENFTKLTQGVNKEIQKWILEKIQPSQAVLEVGCGPGALALKIANKGCKVDAIDANIQMVKQAQTLTPSNPEASLKVYVGNAVEFQFHNLSEDDNIGDPFLNPTQYDAIISTFMLSELRPLEQQIFLREAWIKLHPNGKLILAAEIIPQGLAKIPFQMTRWWYRKKLKKLKSGITHPLKWFDRYLEPIGFKVVSKELWKNGSIKAWELQKITQREQKGQKKQEEQKEPGFYAPPPLSFRGLNALLREIRCVYTGQVDHVPIDPGIYQSGKPTPSSPIIVTANYDYTYIKVMRDLEGIDAWVLVVDSVGINVWCAARGDNFGNRQLLEAVKASGIAKIAISKTLYLPQLCAGGMRAPELPMRTAEFPYNIMYGPVWSKDLPEYLEKKPVQKPERMRLAEFTPFHRQRACLTHISFLMRKIFLKPLLLLAVILAITQQFASFWVLGEIIVAVIISNLVIAVAIPLTKYTRQFLEKVKIFGTVNAILLTVLSMLFHQSLFLPWFFTVFFYWLGFFSTMSFSGYTMATSPREIRAEYPEFTKKNRMLKIGGVLLGLLGIIFAILGVI